METRVTLPLVWHEKDKASIRAARRYALSLIGGAALGFIALLGLSLLGAGEFTLGGTIIENGGQWALWLCLMGFIGFGAKASIIYPQSVADECRALCLQALSQYEKN